MVSDVLEVFWLHLWKQQNVLDPGLCETMYVFRD